MDATTLSIVEMLILVVCCIIIFVLIRLSLRFKRFQEGHELSDIVEGNRALGSRVNALTAESDLMRSTITKLTDDTVPAINSLASESDAMRAAVANLTNEALPAIEEESRKVLAAVLALADPSPEFDSPITRLTFQQSLNHNLFARASEAAALAGLSQPLQQFAADGLQVTLHGVRLTQQGTEMIVSATKSGQLLMDKGLAKYPIHKVSGKRIPQLIDSRTGRVVEKLKEMPVSTITSKFAAISGAVVSAAHLIAGADLAKSLARVESKMDRMLALHRVDQLAKLERIYTSAQELASSPMDKLRRLEMWRLRGELRELRSAWRQECTLKLNHVDDPKNASLWKRMFTRQRTFDQQVVSNISEGETEVALIQYSMRIEHLLAIGSDTLDEFLSSQAGELVQLEALCVSLKEKGAYISGHYPELSVEPMVASISGLISNYRESVPQLKTIDVEPEV